MQKLILKKLLYFVATVYILCNSLEVKAEGDDLAFKEVICKSVTIRSIKDFNGLQNCTVVAGYVRIVETFFSPSDFEELKPSNIEEITAYLLVYHVHGLDSLERLFPKLIFIRGVELLYDEYAFIVIENHQLKNIGLVSLLRVLNGSIRIEHNPSLCFANTINWAWILGNHTKQYYYDVYNNKPPNECPLCYAYDDEFDVKDVNRHKRCWSQNRFQKTILDHVAYENCNGKTNCLTSCSDKNCRHCTNYISDNGCVDTCLPPTYKLVFKRQCVTNCTQWGLLQLGTECVEKCPQHYEEVKINDAVICALNCKGDFIIHHAKDLEGLSECTKIEGSLTLEIYETEKHIVQELENAFRDLNEITGYVKILNSPQIITLHFFKSLHTITGSELLENRYSLYVVNNNFLQELFLRNVIIMNGCLYFHLNPRLCYIKILNIVLSFKNCNDIKITDASTDSNGEMAVCGKDIVAANVTIKDVNSDSALVEMDPLLHDDFQILVGYIYYYKEAPFKNVTRFDGRHGCGKDSWFTDIVLKLRNRHIFKNLKPATQYAYFLNTMTFRDYPYNVEHVSKIQYFKTLPSKPEMVAKLYYHSVSGTEIEIHWWPPRITNGILEKYVLQLEVSNTTMPFEVNNQTIPDVCECPKLHTESYVPTPHVESHYNKENLLYLHSIMNFIYVKKKPTDTTTTTTTARPDTPITTTDESITTTDDSITTTDDSITTTDDSITTTDDSITTTDASITDAAIHSTTTKRTIDWREFDLELDAEALMEQDKEKESYVIPHPYPICNQTNSNIQNQTEKKCVPLERFEGAIEIPGNHHAYILKNLEPEKIYRISLRACVKDLINGCGAARVIFAQTVSKRFETIKENLPLNNSEMPFN